MPLPAVEPTVVLADASPLVHLAMMGRLDLPLRFGPVVVPDAVEIETTHDADKPYAAELLAWMDANARRGRSNRWVDRPATDVGALLRIAVETGRPRPRNVGEHAIVNWLVDHLPGFGGPALVVYENGKVPNMLVREGLADTVVVVTTRTFLHLGHRAGHVVDPGGLGDRGGAGPARQPRPELPGDRRARAMTEDERLEILRRYVDLEIPAGEAADALGPGTAIVDVILQARAAYGRVPDRRDAFTEGEFRRALVLLGLAPDGSVN